MSAWANSQPWVCGSTSPLAYPYFGFYSEILVIFGTVCGRASPFAHLYIRFLFINSGYCWDSVCYCTYFPPFISIFLVFMQRFWLLLGQCVEVLPPLHIHIFGFYWEILVIFGTVCGSTVQVYILPVFHFHIFGFYLEILVIFGTVCVRTSPLACPPIFLVFIKRFWLFLGQCVAVLAYPYFHEHSLT